MVQDHNQKSDLSIDNLIAEVELITQAPRPIIFASILSVLSSTIQGMLDIQINSKLVTPTSLFILTIAESGERKSTVDNLLRKALVEINDEINDENKKMRSHYDSELDKWRIEQKVYQKKYNKSLLEESNNRIKSELKSALYEIQEKKPKLIQMTNILFNDITIEALLFNLTHEQPNTILSTSDAGNMINRLNYQYLSNVNQLWDGDTIQIDRKKEGSFIIKDARLTISLMIQPKTFEEILLKKERIRETGFLARMLFIKPYPSQGRRFYFENDACLYLNAFYKRIKDIYNISHLRSSSGIEKMIAILSPQAKNIWISFYNEIEQLIGREILSDIRDYASKIANNVARVATLIHYFEHDNDEVCDLCMQKAITFGRGCVGSFKSVFGEKTFEEKANEYAVILYNWLQKNIRHSGCIQFYKSHIYQYGPRSLRNKNNLEIALRRLNYDNVIFYYYNAKPAFIEININHQGFNELNH